MSVCCHFNGAITIPHFWTPASTEILLLCWESGAKPQICLLQMAGISRSKQNSEMAGFLINTGSCSQICFAFCLVDTKR